MNATSFKESNFVIGGGQPGVNDLVICVAENERDYPGRTFSISKYKLSPEELAEINRTGEIYVSIMQHPMPPILPSVFSPFSEAYGYSPNDGTCMRCGFVNPKNHLGACLSCMYPFRTGERPPG